MGLVKNLLYKISGAKGITFFKEQSIFPYYHIVRNDSVPHIENLYKYKNVSHFEQDLETLLKFYKPINPKELLNSRNISNTFLLTFDDGLSEIYDVIYPILKAKNVNAIFFINPLFVDNREGIYKHYISLIISHIRNKGISDLQKAELKNLFDFNHTTTEGLFNILLNIKFSERKLIRNVLEILKINITDYLKENKLYITKTQIQEMLDDGFYFGGHTMSHPPLNQLTFEEQKEEIIDSIQWLKTNFSINYSLFAFPFTDKGMSKQLINSLFEYDSNILLFGNSGIKKDIDERIIQRFSLENPARPAKRVIVMENLYKIFNKTIGKYKISRNDRN